LKTSASEENPASFPLAAAELAHVLNGDRIDELSLLGEGEELDAVDLDRSDTVLLHDLWADAFGKIQFKLIVVQFLIHGQLGDGDDQA
jgi:hypothetical protein